MQSSKDWASKCKGGFVCCEGPHSVMSSCRVVVNEDIERKSFFLLIKKREGKKNMYDSLCGLFKKHLASKMFNLWSSVTIACWGKHKKTKMDSNRAILIIDNELCSLVSAGFQHWTKEKHILFISLNNKEIKDKSREVKIRYDANQRLSNTEGKIMLWFPLNIKKKILFFYLLLLKG